MSSIDIPSIDVVTRYGTYSLVVHIAHLPGNPMDLSIAPTDSALLNTRSIQELEIRTVITSPIPTGHILYYDRTGELINLIGCNNLVVTLEIQRYKDKFGPDSKAPAYEEGQRVGHRFFANLEIVTHNVGSDLIKINLLSFNYLLLGQNLVYSTNGLKVNLQTILEDIVALSGFENYSFPNVELITKRTFGYTSTANSSVKDALDYIIDYGFSLDDGLICLTYDLANTSLLFWLQNFFDRTQYIDPNDQARDQRYIGMISSKAALVNLGYVMIEALEVVNNTTLASVYSKISNIRELLFDYENGTWVEDQKKTRQQLLDTFTKATENTTSSDATFMPKIKDWIPKSISVGAASVTLDNSRTRTIANLEATSIQKMREVFMDLEMLVITLPGMVLRTPGDPFVIFMDPNKENRQSSNSLIGGWTVMEVVHQFKPGASSYKNILKLGRNERSGSFKNYELDSSLLGG